MRDSRRIDEVLAALRDTWLTFPDLRLGQLIVAALPAGQSDPFYVEDDVWVDLLRSFAPVAADVDRAPFFDEFGLATGATFLNDAEGGT